MPPIYEPTLATLDALERQWARRLVPHLRAVLRGSTKRLFDEGVSDGLLEVGGRIIELRNTLKAEQTKIGLVAKHYLMAYLGNKHGSGPPKLGAEPVQLARTWLSRLKDFDTHRST